MPCERRPELQKRVQTIGAGTFGSMSDVLSRFVLSPTGQKLSYRCSIAFYLVMVIAGSLPGARVDIGQYASGVVLHSLAYAILTLLLFVGSSGDRAERAVKSVLTVMAMGAGDEYVQSFFPYRTASVTDWAVDAIAGTITSVTLWRLWPRLFKLG